MYVNNLGVHGANAAGKIKPCLMGYSFEVFKGATGLPLETMMSMRQKADTEEDSLLKEIYGNGNTNEYKLAISKERNRHLGLARSIYVRENPDMWKVIQNLNSNMSINPEQSGVGTTEITTEDIVNTPLSG